ncbi:M3 family metallopeptidase [Streptantibioticus silvisoli]|uniref:M3 family metallopeptidase n=1 Tax=Streptantibioticus silvisoli TaxID=2705255 RepID=A0ABT6VXK9_9ACTN|nr:M3 family metallopeptidase [Streptantibioticus silvisoli]MDI5963215.1 M3 family metallopeptidase [Streptantibioticus silvisoli]
MTSTNPFFAPSTLPFRLPDFAAIRPEHYAPAFDRGMAEQLAEIAAITGCGEAPTFDNTVVALERSGRLLERARVVFANQTSADSSPRTEELDAEYQPRFAAHEDAILLDRELFARIDALYADRADLGLDPESLRLLERVHTDFTRAGARLSPDEQRRLREFNAELATLETSFEQNLMADTRARALVLDSAEELAGLSPDAIAAAAENARTLGYDGRWVLSLKLFSNQSELAWLTDRSVRERLLTASLGRGEDVNRDLVVRIATARAERAALLGLPSHAAYVLQNRTAGTTGAVEDFLGRLVPLAVASARAEAEQLKAAVEDGGELAPWDWKFYAEKVRAAEHDIDEAALRPYFELERVLRDGVFHAAGEVYGLRITEREDLTAYHPDARVFEVRQEDGTPVGLFLGDYYARASKRGGAWMNSLVDQSHLFDERPVVVNNLNIAKPPAGEPTLLTIDEVRTLFHEFGHALHGLLSDVRYPSFSGTSVMQDVVEFPSQVNEMWLARPEILSRYAVHHVTGEPLAAEVVERLMRARRSGEGFRTVEYLAATLLDWAWHSIGADTDPGDPLAFEAAALESAGLALELIPPRYRTTYFAHVFAGAYSAGYYSYIWSEVLDADMVEWFEGNGRTVRESGELFREGLLSRGGSVDMMDAYRAVVGQDPRIEPLLARRGLLT